MSIIDQGAFDYTANVWGYTYGAAGEWYQDWWTVRAGVLDLSRAPNTIALSQGFSQGQFATELEERHTLWDQPGKLKLLYCLTRGNLGTYLDAISLSGTTGTTPSTGAVRSFRTKGGVRLNLEQQLATDFGVFARSKVPWRRMLLPTTTVEAQAIVCVVPSPATTIARWVFTPLPPAASHFCASRARRKRQASGSVNKTTAATSCIAIGRLIASPISPYSAGDNAPAPIVAV